jgi:hypothetical protein
MTFPLRPALVGLALMWLGAGPALAQNPAQDTAAGPPLELSTAQRQTIYQSVSKTQKNHIAPTGFRVSVGGRLPDTIELAPMPGTLAELMPQAKRYNVAMIEKQVVLVDPATKQIAAVITQEAQ